METVADSTVPREKSSPPFFSFDGIDGVGKSTQIERFVDWLRQRGHNVVACRDPGSTPLGESVRDILLHREEIPLAARAEMLLYMAARAQLVADVIQPALAAGKTVVSDRYLLANVVYQGHAGGLDVDALWQVGRIATAGVAPTLTFVLDMDSTAAAARLSGAADRLEKRGDDYRERLRQGYLAEAARDEKIVVVDAGRPVDEVTQEIRRRAAAFC